VIDDAMAVQMARYQSFPWVVTNHAAEKYRDRVDPSLGIAGAKRILLACLPAAELLPQPTFSGQSRWLVPGGDAVVVCKPDPKLKARVAVTVLGLHEMYDVDAVPEVVEAFERVAHESPQTTAKPRRRHQPEIPEPVRELQIVSMPEPAKAPLPVVRRVAPAIYGPPIRPSAPRVDPWEQAYRALEKRHENLKRENAIVVLANQALKQRRDPDVEHLRQDVQIARDLAALWKKRAEDAERALRSPEALAAAAEHSVKARDLDRARTHAARMERDRQAMREMVRVAVIGLRTGNIAETLAELERTERGITSDQFCYPDRFTKEERRVAAKETEDAAMTDAVPGGAR
jgi:hypothetical protein